MRTQSLIAIIDDDLAIREALDDFVCSLGHSTIVFESAEQFLGYGRRASIDCILTDVKMTSLSGLELQDRLNQGRNHPPMIFMTSYRDERTRSTALKGGALAFLEKPIDLVELMRYIAIALSI